MILQWDRDPTSYFFLLIIQARMWLANERIAIYIHKHAESHEQHKCIKLSKNVFISLFIYVDHVY